MKVGQLLLLGIIAGILSSILDGFEEVNGLNHIASALILTVSIFITGYFLYRFGGKHKKAE